MVKKVKTFCAYTPLYRKFFDVCLAINTTLNIFYNIQKHKKFFNSPIKVKKVFTFITIFTTGFFPLFFFVSKSDGSCLFVTK